MIMFTKHISSFSRGRVAMAIMMLTRAFFYWRAPHETIYGHKKKVRLEQNISIGSFNASFHNFHNVSIYEMMTKASNEKAFW